MTAWHIDDAALAAYTSGTAPMSVAASAESHLLSCADCRRRVAAAVPRPRLDAIWAEVTETLDAPRPGWAERLLTRLGMAEHTARLVASAPSLRLAWFAGVALCLLFAVTAAATSGPRGLLPFLMIAPLLPVAGVAVAYGQHTDPTYELTLVAPYSSLRLLLLRAAAVLVSTLPLAALAGLLLPGPGWVALAWLLPALGLSALVLLLGMYADPLWSAVGVALGWVTLVGSAFLRTGDAYAVVGPAAQVLSLLLTLACLAVIAGRRRHILVNGSLS